MSTLCDYCVDAVWPRRDCPDCAAEARRSSEENTTRPEAALAAERR